MRINLRSSRFRLGPVVALIFIGFSFSTYAAENRSTAAGSTFYVSSDGDDANSGKQDAPFRTLQRATQTVVQAIRSGMTRDVVVYLRGGTHQLTSTLKLDPASSGRDGHVIRFESYPGEQATISAGRPITGWTLHDSRKNIYRAHVGKGWDFRQLYVNGSHAERARLEVRPADFVRTPVGLTSSTIAFQSWSNVTDIEIVTHGNWMQIRCKIRSVREEHITISEPCWSRSQWALKWGALTPSWIENAYEFLSRPGQWYLNRTSGDLYYIPRAGEQMANADVVAPALQDMIVGVRAHNIAFKNLTFAHSNWTEADTAATGYVGLQGGYHKTEPAEALSRMHSPIHFEASHDILFEADRFSQLGSRALTFDGGSQDVRVIGNLFTEIAAGALQFGQIDDPGNMDRRTQNRGYLIRDNTIQSTGFDYPDDVAIAGLYVAGMNIEHNTIEDIPHIAISLGWGWGKVHSYSSDNNVGWNHVQNFSKIFHDSAAVYTLGPSPGTVIHDNYVSSGGLGYGCLYPDEGSSYEVWERNVCEDVRQWLHIWAHSIHNNAIVGNWSDTADAENNGVSNKVSGNIVVHDRDWPPGAESIKRQAGAH